MVPTVALPPTMPSTLQVAAPPPVTAAVNCCDCDKVSVATRGVVAKADVLVMLTVAVALAEPPEPVQVSEYWVVAFSAPVETLPLVGSLPVHGPPDGELDAMQAVALVELQVSVALPPAGTPEGLAMSCAVGAAGGGGGGVAAVTVTVVLAAAGVVPPAPEQVNVNVPVALKAALTTLPPVDCAPLQAPDAVQAVALVEDQVSVVVPPVVTLEGLALSETVGAAAGGVEAGGVLDAAPEFPPPEQPASSRPALSATATAGECGQRRMVAFIIL
jgi:hypothetical protein